MASLSRGHPLFALLAVLGGWAGGRAATWEAPLVSSPQAAAAAGLLPGAAGAQSLPGYGPGYAEAGYGNVPISQAPVMANERTVVRLIAVPSGFGGNGAYFPPSDSGMTVLPHLRADFARAEGSFVPPPRFYAPEPPGMSADPAESLAAPPGMPAANARARRWSMDAWALLRRDGMAGSASLGALPGSYGASQAGGILRYRLAVSDARRPTLYVRSTATTGQLRETTAALGISARPIAGLPVIAALEGRMSDYSGRRQAQGAAMAITELPVLSLPAGLRGEGYAQAGYVAGAFSTFFADGQLRADRSLLRFRDLDLRVGAGMWGGAQKGAARLDLGPSAAVAVPIGRNLNGRVAVDWRFRVAGDAIPGSGPALTLSTGF